MIENKIQLKKRIMRQIYWLFTKRIVTHELTMQVALLTLALLVFAKMVHVASVIDNFLQVPVSEVPTFLWAALGQGEVVTLLAIGAIVFTALSIPLRLKSMVFHSTVVV